MSQDLNICVKPALPVPRPERDQEAHEMVASDWPISINPPNELSACYRVNPGAA